MFETILALPSVPVQLRTTMTRLVPLSDKGQARQSRQPVTLGFTSARGFGDEVGMIFGAGPFFNYPEVPKPCRIKERAWLTREDKPGVVTRDLH